MSGNSDDDRMRARIDVEDPRLAAQLQAALEAEGFEVSKPKVVERRDGIPDWTPAAAVVAGIVLDRATSKAVDAALASAREWIRKRRQPEPSREGIIYGPDGEVLKRVSVPDEE